MKFSPRILVILCLFILQNSKAADSTKVLFIGNSLTYFNDMPFLFKDIANNQGKNVSVTMYAPGGTGIVHHYVDPNIYDLFRNTSWDIVVIQPGTSESAGVSYPIDTTVFRARILLDSIYLYSPCAKVYLYEIPYGVPSDQEYSTYFSTQTMIRDSVTKMTDSLHLQMIPAGECARGYYNVNQNLLLHNSYNDIHPSPYGSFLTALACYAGIFQDSVSDCTFYSSLEQDTIIKFFTIADSVVLNYFSDWRINTYNLHADFDLIALDYTVNLSNQSLNYSSVLWDFGDASSETTDNPTHTYSNVGTFVITLHAYQNSCVDSISKIVSLSLSGTNSIENVDLGIYPNPVVSTLKIDINFNATSYEIVDPAGKIIMEDRLDFETKQIDVTSLIPNEYFLRIFQNGLCVGQQKFVK